MKKEKDDNQKEKEKRLKGEKVMLDSAKLADQVIQLFIIMQSLNFLCGHFKICTLVKTENSQPIFSEKLILFFNSNFNAPFLPLLVENKDFKRT